MLSRTKLDFKLCALFSVFCLISSEFRRHIWQFIWWVGPISYILFNPWKLVKKISVCFFWGFFTVFCRILNKFLTYALRRTISGWKNSGFGQIFFSGALAETFIDNSLWLEKFEFHFEIKWLVQSLLQCKVRAWQSGGSATSWR